MLQRSLLLEGGGMRLFFFMAGLWLSASLLTGCAELLVADLVVKGAILLAENSSTDKTFGSENKNDETTASPTVKSTIEECIERYNGGKPHSNAIHFCELAMATGKGGEFQVADMYERGFGGAYTNKDKALRIYKLCADIRSPTKGACEDRVKILEAPVVEVSSNANLKVTLEAPAVNKKPAQLQPIKKPETIGPLINLEASAANKKPAQQQQINSTEIITPIGKRIALVVGNANYKIRPLKNPRNDADDISRALRSSGFEVIDLRDATLTQMRTGVRQFGDRLINNDVGLVYYSGHGVEVKGRNYFIPVNADIMREDEIADQGLDVALVLEKMSTAGKGVNILIVDACRDDPFGRSFRSVSRGLAQMDAPRGTIIAYATSPGKVAADGEGRNSPYTKNLVKAMQQPNKPIEQVFKEVRRAVQEETKNQQTPWENTSLSGDFYFRVSK
jgi:hypothetical protein